MLTTGKLRRLCCDEAISNVVSCLCGYEAGILALRMNYVGKVFSSVRGYIGINPATLTGAIDVVVIRQEDGSYLTSPWHVRFGKMGVIRAKQKVVDVEINGEPVDLHMKLGEAGEAFFVEEAEDMVEVPSHLATSPLQTSSFDLMEKGLVELKEFSSMELQSDLPTPVIEQGGGVVITMEGNSPVVSVLPKMSLAQSLPETGMFGSVMDEFKQQCPKVRRTEASTQTDLNGADVDSHKCQFLEDIKMDCDAQLRNAKSSVELSNRLSVLVQNHVVTDVSIAEALEDPNPKKIFTLDPDAVNNDDQQGIPFTDTTQQTHNEKIYQVGRPAGKAVVGENSSDECLFEMELDDIDHYDTGILSGRHVSLPAMQESSFEDVKINTDSRNQFISIYQSFSDTEMTPVVSPSGSRPSSPKSDTELDIVRSDAMSQTHLTGDRAVQADDILWKWGEFPKSSVAADHSAKKEGQSKTGDSKSENKAGLSASILPSGGIYLEDLKQEEMNPELIGLYLYDYRSPQKLEEDRESGRGVSLPQSPVTVQMESPDVTGAEAYDAAQKIAHLDLAMSVCGACEDQDSDAIAAKFQQHIVSYEALCSNPNIFTDPNLIIRMSGKYYKWQVAGPLIMSLLIFNKPVKDKALDILMKQHMPKKEQRKRGWLWWGGKDTAAPLPDAASSEKLDSTASKDVGLSAPLSQPSSPPHSPERMKDRSKSLVKDSRSFALDAETILLAVEKSKLGKDGKMEEKAVKEKYKKSLKLSSDQIAKLNLSEGANEVTFSVTTQYQGTTRCTCYVYLWNWDDKIVVSDIDGTITKSDVLGQVLPMIGHVLPYISNDWSQVGIARLYSMIADNGYKFLYLSARAIGQSKLTRDYLRSIRQGEVSLPDGPLLLSPSSLVSAFHKEVIERKPEEFKISCLKDIKELFPSSNNPFLAGFGNRINDVWAYTTIGIPRSRIFTVNPKGQLRIETLQSFESSYTRLSDIVDHFFLPLDSGMRTKSLPYNNEFNTFTYWREQLPNIDDELNDFLKKVSTEKKNEKKPDKKGKPTGTKNA